MAYLRIFMLVVLAALPFAISFFLETSKGLQRRNIFYRCIKSLDNFLTKWHIYNKLVLFVDWFKRILPKSRNARKLFLYVTALMLVTYQLIDYSCYIQEHFGFTLFSFNSTFFKIKNSGLTEMFPTEYFESIILTLPLAYYPAGNSFLLSLHNCDDRLFLIVNLSLLVLVYITKINVLCISVYILLIAGSYYPNEMKDQDPRAKEPLRRISKYRFRKLGDIVKAA